VDVRLVEDDDAARVRDDIFDGSLGRPRARRRVGVDYELQGRMVGRELLRPGPALGAWMRSRHRFVDPAQRLEQGVGRGRIRDMVTLADKRPETHLDEVVGAIPEGNSRWIYVEVGGDGRARGCRGRAWIQPQRISGRGLDGL